MSLDLFALTFVDAQERAAPRTNAEGIEVDRPLGLCRKTSAVKRWSADSRSPLTGEKAMAGNFTEAAAVYCLATRLGWRKDHVLSSAMRIHG